MAEGGAGSAARTYRMALLCGPEGQVVDVAEHLRKVEPLGDLPEHPAQNRQPGARSACRTGP